MDGSRQALPGGTAVESYSIDSMPFFKLVPGRGRDFWAIEPPEGYEAACDYGVELACKLLCWRDETGVDPFAQIVRNIALDQIARGCAGAGEKGALVGFWGVLGELAGMLAGPGMAARYRNRLETDRARLRALWPDEPAAG